MSVAFPQDNIRTIEDYYDGATYHYAIPRKSISGYDKSMEHHFKQLLAKCKPDLIHLHGTEFSHGLAIMNACPDEKYIVSIQGLASIYTRHYHACVPQEVIRSTTLREFFKRDGILNSIQNMNDRGIIETEILKRTKHIIGRTEWDKACTRLINPNAEYHVCNESLRKPFYEHSWDLANCDKYSIFVSQAHYPIKGLHFVLEAMPEILKRFPEARLCISGGKRKEENWFDRLKFTSYEKYIRHLISINRLEDKITYVGILDENQICERFLKSHIFISPSSIENESNSLGEAMILGVPCIASFVGGVIDRMTHNVEGFMYQYDAPYMLAHHVCEIFANDELAEEFSRNARQRASKTCNKEANINRILEIYKTIIA